MLLLPLLWFKLRLLTAPSPIDASPSFVAPIVDFAASLVDDVVDGSPIIHATTVAYLLERATIQSEACARRLKKDGTERK